MTRPLWLWAILKLDPGTPDLHPRTRGSCGCQEWFICATGASGDLSGAMQRVIRRGDPRARCKCETVASRVRRRLHNGGVREDQLRCARVSGVDLLVSGVADKSTEG